MKLSPTAEQRAMMVDVLSVALKKVEEQKNPPVSTKEALATIFVNVISVPWVGWVLSILWGWFVLHLWPGAPQLTWLSAVGLVVVVYYFTYTSQPERRVTLPSALTYRVFFPAFLLIEGYLIHIALLNGWFGG